MVESAKKASGKRMSSIVQRRHPIQDRGKKRTQQILDNTARLLEEVGVDDLTTILIAQRVGISVGALYHYYPNKHAILHALGARWLDEMTRALEDLEALDIETFDSAHFADMAVDKMLLVYRQQRALLPLMQALWSVPELRQLDSEHDELYIAKMAGMLKRLGHTEALRERKRIARVYLHLTHGVLMAIVRQSKSQAAKTLDDLKRMVVTLLGSE